MTNISKISFEIIENSLEIDFEINEAADRQCNRFEVEQQPIRKLSGRPPITKYENRRRSEGKSGAEDRLNCNMQ